MPLIHLLLFLVVIGVALYIIETYIPMAEPIKLLIRVIVAIVVVLMLLQLVGVVGPVFPVR